MKMKFRHTTIIVFLLYPILILICSGCAPKTSKDMELRPTQEQEQKQEHPQTVYEKGDTAIPTGYYVHTVKLPGESLSIIAKWFTGDLNNWNKLTKYNPKINPNRIHLGDKIKIPRRMMTRHSPITLQFVEESQPKAKRSRQKPAVAPEKPIKTEPTATAAEPQKAPPETKTQESQTLETQPEAKTQETPPKEIVEEDEPFLFGPRDYQKD